MMVWYLVMTEAIVVAQGKIAIEIGKEVVSGEIANYLNKPYEYMLYKYFSTIGASIATFSLIIIAGGIAASIMVGPLQISLTTIPFILFSSLLGITLNFIMMYTLGIFALWMEDSKALDFIYQKLLFTVGGMLAPLDIFPAWFSSISILLPFSYVAYAPAKLFVSFTFEKFIQIIPIQIFWIIVTFLAATLVFKILSRRVSINGG
jgi:ABC-2 type transport system permease protein